MMDYSNSEEIKTVIRNYGIDIPGLNYYVDFDKYVFRLFGDNLKPGTPFINPKRTNKNSYPYKLSEGAKGTSGTAAKFCDTHSDTVVLIGNKKCISFNHVVQYCTKNNLNNVRPLIVDICNAAKQYEMNPSSIDPKTIEINRLKEELAEKIDIINKLTGATIEQPLIIPLPEVKKEHQCVLSEKTMNVMKEQGMYMLYQFNSIALEEIVKFIPQIFRNDLKEQYVDCINEDGETLLEATFIVPMYSSVFIDRLESVEDCHRKKPVRPNQLMKDHTKNTPTNYQYGSKSVYSHIAYGDEYIFVLIQGNQRARNFYEC